MTLLSLQSPAIRHPSANPSRFVHNSTNSNNPGFNYVYDVLVNDQYIGRDIISPAPVNGYGVYDTRTKVSTYLSTDPITASTTATIVAAPSTWCNYQLKVGESYSYLNYTAITSAFGKITFDTTVPHTLSIGDFIYMTPADDDPANDYSGKRLITDVTSSTSLSVDGSTAIPSDETGRIRRADGSPIINSGITSSSVHYSYKSAHDRNAYFNYDSADWIIGSSASARFSTNIPRQDYIRLRNNSRLWLYSMFNFNADHIKLFTYDQSGTLLGQYKFDNPIAFDQIALYSRVGPLDLADASSFTVVSGSSSLMTSSVHTYTVQWFNASNAARSEMLSVMIDRTCTPPESPVQLFFLDQKGSYVTAVCGPRKESRKTDKRSYKRSDFTITQAAPYLVSDASIAQHVVFAVDMEEKFSTSIILRNKTEAAFFQELFMSTEVFEIQSDGSLLPVIVAESEPEAVNPFLIQGPMKWTVNYSYAYDQPLNV